MSSDMIDYLMGQPDGANYVVLYQMLCLKTINTGGRLAFQIGDMIIPYDVEKIQRECKWFSLATVRVALEVYKQIGLIYEDKDGVLVLANYSDIVGSETDYSAQKRLQRENRRRQLPPKCADSNEDNNVDNVHEEQEEGVSGHKVRAEARDKLQIIKEYARKGKFDILLVFMFDRIGRIADETPFVVEWFVRNGIRVWSTQEGEQRFDNHTDKLLNYIRFWQADGESEKTSVRTRTSLRQLVEEGHFKGGSAPYGYDLVKSGRINKRKHELYELHINEQEAEIVRLIFDKYVYEGYGAQRIATYLNNAGYRARSGKCWHPGSLRGMVGNLTYMGVLRCGDARSELMPELQIIPQEEFEAAQRIREDRSAHAAEEAEHHVPLRTRGQALLSNNVYCGHCGARLALTTSRKWRKLSDGTLDDTLRIRYTCYGKLRKQTDCTGQTGYTMHILDEIIDKMVRQIFSRLRGIPKEQLITSRYAKETAERKNHLQALQAERDKAEKDLLALKTEILAVIKGESAFPKDTLAEMIAAQEKKHTELDTLCEEASAELERNAELMANVSQLYEELISYADLYDSASFEAKKMIVSQLIRRVEVYRGYQIHVDFNFDLAQYLENSDELAC